MDREIAKRINWTARNYFQFAHQHQGNKNSALFIDIMTVLNCTEAEAEKFASTHCNMVSFWNGLFSTEKINMIYQDFFKEMLRHNFCNYKGFFDEEKNVISKNLFNLDIPVNHITDYANILDPSNLDPDSAYQMLIHPEPGADHFVITYIDENIVLMGADTSYRGTPFAVADKISEQQFGWLLKL